MSVVFKIYSATYKFFKDNLRLSIPFLFLFLLQILVFILLYFSPYWPLRKVFGPIVRTFWGLRYGNSFLHYPSSFILLPKIFQISSLALSVFAGALTSGMAIIMISWIQNKKKTDLPSVARQAFSKYMYLFIIVVLWAVSLHYATKFFDKATLYLTGYLFRFTIFRTKFILILKAITWFLTIMNFILTVAIHSLLVYAIPVLIFEKAKLWKSILKSLLFFKARWKTTLILVGLPMLTYVPFSLLLQDPVFLINKFSPEFVAYVIFLGILVNFLLIDPLITVSAALFYLSPRKEK